MTAGQEKDFLGAFAEHWDDYRKQYKAARQDLSEKSVHDLRVAARRFLALLVILRSLDDHPHVKRLRFFLKKQLSQLDELHDAQVMVQETTERAQRTAMLDMFQAHLQERAAHLTRKARKHVRSSTPSELKKWVGRMRTVAESHSQDRQLPEHLMQAVDVAHADTVRAFSLMDPKDPASIHRVRIAFKKLRYMIETIHPLLTGYPRASLERMHRYQERMGQIHDTALLLDALAQFEASASPPSAQSGEAFNAGQIEELYRRRLKELIRTFLEHRDEFEEFWRATPDQPFPWENNDESLHRSARNRRTTTRQRQPTGQPAGPDKPGTEKVPEDRTGTNGDGDADRPDPHFPVPSGS